MDLPAFRRAFDFLGTTLDSTPDGNLSQAQIDQLQADFGQAFSRLPVAGWVLIGVILSGLALAREHGADPGRQPFGDGRDHVEPRVVGPRLEVRFHRRSAAVRLLRTHHRVGRSRPGPGRGSNRPGRTAVPGLAVALGLLAFIGSIVLSVWLTGRLIPTLAQVVVAGGALRWSWRATKGKVLGSAGPLPALVAGGFGDHQRRAHRHQHPGESALPRLVDQRGSLLATRAALSLNLILLPLSMATAAITIVGIVPIWRDLTDHPVYRSIDDEGLPITQPGREIDRLCTQWPGCFSPVEWLLWPHAATSPFRDPGQRCGCGAHLLRGRFRLDLREVR